MWYFKCRECGSEFEENESLPMQPNPSGIMQEVCPKCGGAFNHKFRPTQRTADLPCICAEIESAGVVNPDCPRHGSIRANR